MQLISKIESRKTGGFSTKTALSQVKIMTKIVIFFK